MNPNVLICLPVQWLQETQVRSLGREDPLKEKMGTRSRILTRIIPCTEEPGRLQSMGSQRVGPDWACRPRCQSFNTSPQLLLSAPALGALAGSLPARSHSVPGEASCSRCCYCLTVQRRKPQFWWLRSAKGHPLAVSRWGPGLSLTAVHVLSSIYSILKIIKCL